MSGIVDLHQQIVLSFVFFLGLRGHDPEKWTSVFGRIMPKEGAMWWNDYGPMPWMFFGSPVMIVFVIMCFVMMFVMMRGMRHRSRGDYASEILKERFARGEISQAEYEERRRVLGS